MASTENPTMASMGLSGMNTLSFTRLGKLAMANSRMRLDCSKPVSGDISM